MRRFKQELSQEECKQILGEQKRGVLSLVGDGGYPYGIPMSYLYCEEEGKIYFHGAKEGHKIDAIKNGASSDSDARGGTKASFCVMTDGKAEPGEWALNFKSVIVFGTIRLVDDEENARKICTALVQKFTDDQDYLQKELKNALPRVQCLELTIEHLSGKRVKEE